MNGAIKKPALSVTAMDGFNPRPVGAQKGNSEG